MHQFLVTKIIKNPQLTSKIDLNKASVACFVATVKKASAIIQVRLFKTFCNHITSLKLFLLV